MTAPLHRLYGAPCSQPWESPSSWASRAALSQGLPVRPFLEYLGIDPSGDVDLSLIQADQSSLRHACRLPDEHLWLSRRLLGRLTHAEVDTKRFLLGSSHGGRPRYRFCPLCLKDQRTPYLPIHWRFVGFRYCRFHHCMLEEQCQHCNSPLTLPVSQLTAGPKGKGIAYLKWCMTCGTDLSQADTVSTAQTFSLINNLEHALLKNGIAVLAALHADHLYTEDCATQLPLSSLRRIDNQNMLPHKPDWLCMKVIRGRLQRRMERHAMEREADIARLREEGWTGMAD